MWQTAPHGIIAVTEKPCPKKGKRKSPWDTSPMTMKSRKWYKATITALEGPVLYEAMRSLTKSLWDGLTETIPNFV